MKGLVFTYAMTFGGSVVGFFNPWAGVLVYICFALIKPDQTWADSVPVGNYSRIIAISLLLGWAAQGFGKWNFGKATGIVCCIVGYLVWLLVTARLALDPDTSWPFVEVLAKTVVPLVVAMTLIDSPQKLRQLAWVISLSMGYLAVNENQMYFQYGPQPAESADNMVAHSMTVGAGVSFCLGLCTQHKLWRWLPMALAALSAHATMIRMSRGAMIGIAMCGLAAFLVLPKSRGNLTFFGLALAAALCMAGPSVKEEFLSSFAGSENRDASAQSRFDLWRDMFDVTAKHPLLGVGPQNWPLIAHEYGWPPGKQGHGLWPQTAAELGLPGVGLLAGFYGLLLAKLWDICRRPARSADPVLTGFARIAFVAIAGFVAEAQFGSFMSLEVPYYVGLLGASTIMLDSRMQRGGQLFLGHPWAGARTLATA